LFQLFGSLENVAEDVWAFVGQDMGLEVSQELKRIRMHNFSNSERTGSSYASKPTQPENVLELGISN
jgi:hypothetical protein